MKRSLEVVCLLMIPMVLMACEGEVSTTDDQAGGSGTVAPEDTSEAIEDGESTEDSVVTGRIPDGYKLSEEAYWRVVDLGESSVWRNIELMAPEEGLSSYILTGDEGAVALYDGVETEFLTIGVTSSVRSGWGESMASLTVVGEDGLVKQWNEELGAWSEGQPSGLPPADSMGTLHSVYGNRATNIYMGGTNGQLYHWKGDTWLSMQGVAPVKATDTVDNIWVSDADIVFVVAGKTLYWGKSIEWQSVELNKAMKSVFGFKSDNVYAAGGFGGTGFSDTIVNFSLAGWVSQQTPAPSAQGINDIWGSAPDNVLAVGFKGTLLQLNPEDGTGWNVVDPSNLSQDAYALKNPPWASEDETQILAPNLTLRSITGRSSNDMVVVATQDTTSNEDDESGMVLHFQHHLVPIED